MFTCLEEKGSTKYQHKAMQATTFRIVYWLVLYYYYNNKMLVKRKALH
jgi:hypothetical protein